MNKSVFYLFFFGTAIIIYGTTYGISKLFKLPFFIVKGDNGSFRFNIKEAKLSYSIAMILYFGLIIFGIYFAMNNF